MANPDQRTEPPAPADRPADGPAEAKTDTEASSEADNLASTALEPTRDQELSTAVAALTDDDIELSDRRRMLGRIVRLQIRDRGVRDLFKPKKAVQWIAD